VLDERHELLWEAHHPLILALRERPVVGVADEEESAREVEVVLAEPTQLALPEAGHDRGREDGRCSGASAAKKGRTSSAVRISTMRSCTRRVSVSSAGFPPSHSTSKALRQDGAPFRAGAAMRRTTTAACALSAERCTLCPARLFATTILATDVNE
jgi:hypothetical protein